MTSSLSCSNLLSVNTSSEINFFLATFYCAVSNLEWDFCVKGLSTRHFLKKKINFDTENEKNNNPLPMLMDISATRWQKWVNIDSARNHRRLSHPLHVIPVFQGNSLCGNSLCLTSPGDRMHLIQSTWSGLLLLREINTGSVTSNQALITFSMLIAVGQDVI